MTRKERQDVIDWLDEMAKIYEQRVRDLLSPVTSIELGKVSEELRYAEAIEARCKSAIELIRPIQTCGQCRYMRYSESGRTASCGLLTIGIPADGSGFCHRYQPTALPANTEAVKLG